MEHFDVAVIGLGGIGSATAWYAARSGRSVMGLERFALGGHSRGASHDHSRIIRHSYHTAHYVELTHHAYACWRDVEETSGERCVNVTGGIDLFPRHAAIDIDTYRQAMRSNDISFDELSAAETMRRWPAWRLVDDVHVLYQANTGIVSPAQTVPLLQKLAADAGAVLRGESRVIAIEPDGDDVMIHIDGAGALIASQVVLGADAWTAPLLQPLELSVPLTVTKEQVTYYATNQPEVFDRTRFPVWIWMDDPSFYGFPTFGAPGVKIAQDCGGRRARNPRAAGRGAPHHTAQDARDRSGSTRCSSRRSPSIWRIHVRLADNEHVEREPREAIGDRPHLLEETWTAGGQSNDVEAAPFGDGVAT